MRKSRTYQAGAPPASGRIHAAVLLGAVVPAAAAAQEADPKPQRATLAYFGERVTQPGVRIGYEGAALYRKPHELLLAGSIGGFAVTSGYALMVLFEGGYRVTAPFGGFLDLRPGIGYTAAWIDTGGLTNVSNYLTLSAMGGIGFDFFRRLRVPISVMARSGVLWRSGTGPVEGVSYALDVGIAYQFGTGRPRPPTLPVAFPPPAEAPANLDDPLVPIAPAAEPPGGALSPAAPISPAGSPAAPVSPAAGPPEAPPLPTAAPAVTPLPAAPPLPPPPLAPATH